MVNESSGGDSAVKFWCSSGGSSRPGYTQIMPSRSTHGSALMRMPLSSLVDGVLVHSPLALNCQPWYGHCTSPSFSLPRLSGHARCAHESRTQPTMPFLSRKSTHGSPNSSSGISLSSVRLLVKSIGYQNSRSRPPVSSSSSGASSGGPSCNPCAAPPSALSRSDTGSMTAVLPMLPCATLCISLSRCCVCASRASLRCTRSCALRSSPLRESSSTLTAPTERSSRASGFSVSTTRL
mmetsp:Transcript_18727/g.58209  ORF Transcript_18727/g.58209 Transcript_18727/m.58209 type:complete len:237 (+) Transcript_18727:215-925(+)